MKELDNAITQHACILMDGAAFDAPRFVYEQDEQPELEYLYLGTRHHEAMEVSPCLVKPSPMSQMWDKQFQWRQHAVVLISCEGLNVLADHLRSLLSVEMPDGSYSYLRFYSSRQFQHLMNALSSVERNRFAGPVRKWLSFQSDGSWHCIEADGSGQCRRASDEGWFALTELHIKVLSAGAEDKFVEKLSQFLGVENRARLKDLTQEARLLGFRTEKDVSRYAELVVVHGERIKHPEIQAILSMPEISAGMKLCEVDKRLAYGVAS